MTEDRLPLADLLAKAGDGDFLRSVAEAVLQMLMEADVEGQIGVARHERTGERQAGDQAFAHHAGSSPGAGVEAREEVLGPGQRGRLRVRPPRRPGRHAAVR